jgi:hypothetical protein
MGLVLAPILEGKLEEWKSWNVELAGAKKGEFDEFNRRYELTRHEVWLAETPGGPMAVVRHDGPGGDTFMQKLSQSDHSFDVAMKESIESFHAMDLSAPPPGPIPVRMI